MKQPAIVNYFFGEAYSDCVSVIKDVFGRCGEAIGDSWESFVDSFINLKDDIVGVITFSSPFTGFFKSIWHAIVFGWFFGVLVFNLIVTPVVTAFFSLIHVLVLLFVMFGIYLTFMFVTFLDFLLRSFKKISSGCPNPQCQQKFSLPIYICPNCGAEHTKLKPSKYGIFYRTCQCGNRLPSTFFNGRQKLDCKCPFCGEKIQDGGMHVEIWIPVIGGPNSGKTCLVNMAIAQIERRAAAENDLDFEYVPNGKDNYSSNIQNLDRGLRPFKTGDMKLNFYQFHLKHRKDKVYNLISLCDVGGEVFSGDVSSNEELSSQLGFRNANAYLVLIDPLSISVYREEVADKIDVNAYGASDKPMDEVLGTLLSLLDNMLNARKNKKLSINLSVVFTKSDIPGLDEKIGKTATQDYMAAHPDCDRWQAKNEVCRQFLKDYEEVNLLNTLEKRFKNIQFFTCSALGHNVDGSLFAPDEVEDCVLWMIDQSSGSINLDKKWGKKI